MDVAIVPVFCAHIIGLVGGGEAAKIANQFGVAGFQNILAESIERFESGFLHVIPHPGGEVALGISPSDGVWHGDFGDGRFEMRSFGDSDEFVVENAKPRIDEIVHEVENSGVGPLVFAKSLKVHKKVHEIAIQTSVVEPRLVFFNGERPFGPIFVGKAEGNVVGKTVVF